MLQLQEQPAGHDKDPRIQKVLPLEPVKEKGKRKKEKLPLEHEEVIEPNDFVIPAFKAIYPDKFQIGDRVIVKTFQGNPNHAELKLVSGKQATVRGYAHQSYLLSFDGKPHICYWNEEDLELYTEPEPLFIIPSIEQQVLPLEQFKVGDRITPVNKILSSQRFGQFATVTGNRPDKKKGVIWSDIVWNDGTIDWCIARSGLYEIVEPENTLEQTPICRSCGLAYEINRRLNDGYCDDCRNELNDLSDRLATLEQQRDSIRADGPIAPPNVWIEYGKCSKRKFRQAYYRSTKPIFPAKRQGSLTKSETGLVKRQYIGEENSPAAKAAGNAIARRNQLDVISREIRLIERKLND